MTEEVLGMLKERTNALKVQLKNVQRKHNDSHSLDHQMQNRVDSMIRARESELTESLRSQELYHQTLENAKRENWRLHRDNCGLKERMRSMESEKQAFGHQMDHLVASMEQQKDQISTLNAFHQRMSNDICDAQSENKELSASANRDRREAKEQRDGLQKKIKEHEYERMKMQKELDSLQSQLVGQAMMNQTLNISEESASFKMKSLEKTLQQQRDRQEHVMLENWRLQSENHELKERMNSMEYKAEDQRDRLQGNVKQHDYGRMRMEKELDSLESALVDEQLREQKVRVHMRPLDTQRHRRAASRQPRYNRCIPDRYIPGKYIPDKYTPNHTYRCYGTSNKQFL